MNTLLPILRTTQQACTRKREALVQLGMERNDQSYITRAALVSHVEQAIEALVSACEREPLA